MVSVNVIYDACFVIPNIGNVDTNIVHYINPRLIWADDIEINICFVAFLAIFFTTNYYFILIL